ncbi:M14 family zinc carboxypeptidase [Methylibium sp.]|uniref:M14 family zinc carboxypeptidase n=1 Tax=Methylibium sp. TaxID=2067992 RepID=UPI0025CF6700|nr:M14 family zinc carboxypeptidase [Methylibium sp.]
MGDAVAGLPSELADIAQLVSAAGPHAAARTVAEVVVDGTPLPVYAVVLGSADTSHPGVGFFGGVHGLERIGTEVVIACLRALVQRLKWDATLQRLLTTLRIVFMPLVNPGGLWRGTRANPQGVDLMRNSPVGCAHAAPPLLGGQRLSAALPWYRGPAGAPMQIEAQAVCQVVEEELLCRPFALTVDCHSGFGLRDRLWFPHAHTPVPVRHLPELLALTELLDANLAHHRYIVEPQSRQYLAHGDLWDHLYLKAERGGRVLLPLTLEMGSWLWIKKNPRQMFSRQGLFNPLTEHRQHRVLRRHMGLLEFLLRAACSYRAWCPAQTQRELLRERALQRWYAAGRPS